MSCRWRSVRSFMKLNCSSGRGPGEALWALAGDAASRTGPSTNDRAPRCEARLLSLLDVPRAEDFTLRAGPSSSSMFAWAYDVRMTPSNSCQEVTHRDDDNADSLVQRHGTSIYRRFSIGPQSRAIDRS